MSPLRRTRTVAHERARLLAALALDEPLGRADATWLTDHLAGCDACREAAADYGAQREQLRGLPVPEPPRDLWARTSVALDLAERATGRQREPRATTRPSRSPALLGLLAAACVLAVVVGSSLLAGVAQPPSGPAASAGPVARGSTGPSAGGTPIPVAAGNVGWVTRQDDGRYALNLAAVDSVCPPDAQQACAPLDGSAHQIVALDTKPALVVLSSQRPEAVVVGGAGHASGVYVVTLPEAATPSPTPSTSDLPSPSGTPASTPTPGGSQASSATPSIGPSTAPPTSAPASPSSTATGSPGASLGPGSSLAPGPQATQAILDGAVMVGTAASYSESGQWFAFTAQPVDRSHGPDIYVWHVGEAKARAVTADHASIFSDWLGDLAIGSSAAPEPYPQPSEVVEPGGSAPASPSATSTAPPSAAAGSPSGSAPAPSAPVYPALPVPVVTPIPSAATTAIPRSFLLDPATGAQQQLQGFVWRPVVDPTGTYVAYWSGTLRFDPLTGWAPDQGDLYLASWPSISQPVPGQTVLLPSPSTGPEQGTGPASSDGSSAGPTSGFGEPAASVSPAPAIAPLRQLLEPDRAGSGTPATGWDVRWDTAGQHLAAWIADAVDPTVGRLRLLTVDRSTGLLDPAHQLLTDAPALAGYSIGDDRLAWATPPGQDGEGSHVMVLGWRGDDAGKIRTLPASGTDAVVVIR